LTAEEKAIILKKDDEVTYREKIKSYYEKMEHLNIYYEALTTKEFYREIFPEGTFSRTNHPEDKKPNGIIQVEKIDGKQRSIIVHDELSEIEKVENAEFAIMNGVSYFGNRGIMENSSFMYAMIFDLDDMTLQNLKELIYQMSIGLIPQCSLLTLSGGGAHIYYIFEEPIALYKPIQKVLNDLKKALTTVIWNSYTSSNPKIQRQSIFQKFKVVGGLTKFQNGIKVVGYQIGGKTTITELLGYLISQDDVVDVSIMEPLLQREEKTAKPLKLFVTPNKVKLKYSVKEEKIKRARVNEDVSTKQYKTKLTIAEAKILYPE